MRNRLAILAVMLSAALPAMAAENCREHIAGAARRAGIPESVALSVGMVESGHDPMAMNIAGLSARARSANDGAIAVRKLNAAGIKLVDVGCMQINLKHHPAAFPHLEDAFDPSVNAEYGVQFLKRLYEQKKSWAKAIASYHSADPERQDQYLRLVRSRLVDPGRR